MGGGGRAPSTLVGGGGRAPRNGGGGDGGPLARPLIGAGGAKKES